MSLVDQITFEQAISVLPEGDYVHTFRNGAGMFIGADWSRTAIISALAQSDVIRPTGKFAIGMGHGIAINESGRTLFIATDEAKLADLLTVLESAWTP